jgi:hypothetical protein
MPPCGLFVMAARPFNSGPGRCVPFLGLAATLDPVAYTSLAAVRTTSSTSPGFESMGTWLLSTS